MKNAVTVRNTPNFSSTWAGHREVGLHEFVNGGGRKGK